MATRENLLAPDAVCTPGTPLATPPPPDPTVASALKVLGDPARLRIVQLLAVNGAVCACDLEVPLGLSQPTVSHHLRQLVEAGLLEREKRGTWAFYRVVDEALGAVGATLAELATPGHHEA